MTFDVERLNPTEQRDQWTVFVVASVCLRCGHGRLSRRRDRSYRCDGCHRLVSAVEYAPTVVNLPPDEQPFRRSSLLPDTAEPDPGRTADERE